MEEKYIEKLIHFVEAILVEKPEIIALQEVNQLCHALPVPKEELAGYYPCHKEAVIREGNYIWSVIKMLRLKGGVYYWTWLPLKKGYDKYDEGIAFMSRSPINRTEVLHISKINDYNNWKTRKLLGISVEEFPNEWFYSVHYGWWNDEEEPFQQQWKKTDDYMKKYNKVWLMGDFNNPSEVEAEGYDMVADCGWLDSYMLAERKDLGITVGTVIDGWKEKIKNTNGMRIDQIWCNQPEQVKSSKVIFNGKNYPIISDHYGVMIEVERSKE